MVTLATARLFGRAVGTLRWDERQEVVHFEYDPTFAALGIEPSPLMMPVHRGRVYSFPHLGKGTFNGLPGLFADSLPDTYGRALLDRWLALTGRSSSNPVETLCYMGTRCMGALEYEPAIAVGTDIRESFEVDTLVEVARAALDAKSSFGTNLNDDRKEAIAAILRLGTSAGGQRAKAIIAYNKATGEVRSGQVDAPDGFDYYIIKLDGVSSSAGFKPTENYGRLEYSFYKLALECGITMTECSLLEENGRAHFLTKRFDRQSGGEKVHMQTLCAMAHFDYGLLHAYSYEQAFNVMRKLRLPYSSFQQMFRRMVFNVVVRNQDDHTKNISFLMGRDGIWTLSPAYDIGYAYNPAGGWTSAHQMSVNGHFEGISREDLVSCSARNSIKDADLIIDEICEKASHWQQTAINCGVPEPMVREIMPNLQLAL